MTVRNKLQLAHEWRDRDDLKRGFLDLYPYIRMLRGCYLDANYIPSRALVDSFVLTLSGESILQEIIDDGSDLDEDSIRMAVVALFSHDEIFVDLIQSNEKAIKDALSEEMNSGAIRFPQEYGRKLYDRFFNLFPTRTDRLSFEETLELIGQEPNATYQFGTLVIGPLGVAKSATIRNFPPAHNAPLWHCSDIGCSALHTVRFESAPCAVNRAGNLIQSYFRERRVAPSEWDSLFSVLTSADRDFYGESRLPKLPWLLSDGFAEDELRQILKTSLEMDPSTSRSTFRQLLNTDQNSEVLASHLTEQDIFQCLLLLDDRQIGCAIEKAILNEAIHIPSAELRIPVASRNISESWWKLQSQVGALGLRTVSPRRNFSLIRLQKLLQFVATNTDSEDVLNWELRFVSGEDVNEKLLNAIHSTPPKELLDRVVLSSPQRLAAAVSYLQPMWFEAPTTAAEEQLLMDRFLWKLGFSVTTLPRELSDFLGRSDVLRHEVEISSDDLSAERKDSIRSAAVNYFVSLEDILDRTMSFSGWALTHDHYGDEKRIPFSFNLAEARRETVALLNGFGQTELLREDGHNTLWPLIDGIKRLSDYLNELVNNSTVQAESLRTSLPEFAASGAAPFPFMHRVPIFDLTPGSSEAILDVLRISAQELTSIDLSNLRNRLEHLRPDYDFPSAAEIRGAMAVVNEVVSRFELSGVLPILNTFQSNSIDQYGRTNVVLTDYASRLVTLPGPTSAEFTNMPSINASQIPFKFAKLNMIPDILRFSLMEESNYRFKWRNYPRRMERGPTAEINSELE